MMMILIINMSENKIDREGYSVFIRKNNILHYLGCVLLLKNEKNIIDIKDSYICPLCHNNKEKIKSLILRMRKANKKEITLNIEEVCYGKAKEKTK